MKVTRTQFLTALATGLTALVADPARLLAAPLPEAPLGPDRFLPHVGSSFLVADDEHRTVTLVLANVRTFPSGAAIDQFSLQFFVPGGESLKERIYLASHPSLGELQLFLTPGARVDGKTAYRADFSLLKTAPVQSDDPARLRRAR